MTENKKSFLSRGRIIRWGIYVALLVIVMTQFQRFGCSSVSSEASLAMSPVLERGKSYLFDKEPEELLMRDAIVLWYTRDPKGVVEAHYSRVRGIPGDKLKRVGETWSFEDAEGEMHYLPRDLGRGDMQTLLDRRLGEGEYFLLNDNRTVDLPDSRTLGFIHRKWIRARILPSLFGGSR